MNTRWKVLSLGAVGAIALVAAAVMLRTTPAPIAPPSPKSVEVFVFAEYPELGPFAAGTLQVRLLDLTSTDSAGMLIATSSIDVPPRSKQQGWSLRVPADRARFAEEAYVVVSLKDDKGVRFIASGFPRELTHTFRGSPSRPNWLGIRLNAVPAP